MSSLRVNPLIRNGVFAHDNMFLKINLKLQTQVLNHNVSEVGKRMTVYLVNNQCLFLFYHLRSGLTAQNQIETQTQKNSHHKLKKP